MSGFFGGPYGVHVGSVLGPFWGPVGAHVGAHGPQHCPNTERLSRAGPGWDELTLGLDDDWISGLGLGLGLGLGDQSRTAQGARDTAS